MKIYDMESGDMRFTYNMREAAGGFTMGLLLRWFNETYKASCMIGSDMDGKTVMGFDGEVEDILSIIAKAICAIHKSKNVPLSHIEEIIRSEISGMHDAEVKVTELR